MEGAVEDEADQASDDRRRRGTGAAAQLVVTLLGDYWYAATGFVPSSALVALAGEFGMSEAATRAALSRLSRDGGLEGTRSGRTTAYRLAPDLVGAASRAGRELMQFAAEPLTWDGRWTCVAFAASASDGRRRTVRRRLRRLGLAPLFEHLWITPRPVLGAVRRAVAGGGDGETAVFRATTVEVSGGADPLAAWDLGALRECYDELAEVLEGVRRRLDQGSIGAADALLARTDALIRWRDLVGGDPRIPDELLPDDWPRATLRRAFVQVYDGLGPLAELRVRQLVGDVDPAVRPSHHGADDVV